ncbi:Replicase polyprotein 1ab [Micromonospora sp. HNM0581]|uniref:tetratricopeptide repeat protein n=1 Tax=Micromonospora sp. HNM0581 TaxID=2716341 RepID=UPI001F10628E|nr:Replicase polyprotein 1ab [Micromonospora sp. HNM0581]
MAKPVAETVARHLVATGRLIDDDPAGALAHALAARRLASRIAAVREAVGLAAYHAGEWQSAIAELRTYHRMSGAQSHLAVIADSERALGRPERAIDLFRGADQEKLDPAVAIELLIVAAGARGDLGQRDAAVAMLQVSDLTADAVQPWTARLRYAYADALLAVGRRTEAREWFSRSAEVDTEAETDAAERLLELDGVVIEGDDEDEVTGELAADPGAPGTVPARPDADPSTADRTDQDDDVAGSGVVSAEAEGGVVERGTAVDADSMDVAATAEAAGPGLQRREADGSAEPEAPQR